jgi:tRNA A37 threonylcarbamoyladenosine dehydratase
MLATFNNIMIDHSTNPRAASSPDRTQILIGTAGRAYLKRLHLLVVGLGGVGSYAVENLARAGVGRLTLIDGDDITDSNCNRQLLALHSTLGRSKVTVMAERIADITPDCQVHCLKQRLQPDAIADVFAGQRFDYVLDAIDQIDSKVALLAQALQAEIPVASAMGAGGRINPLAVQVTDLMRSHGCPLARETRRRLRRAGFDDGVLAVWSNEPPSPPYRQDSASPTAQRIIGSISYVPALFGILLAGCALHTLLAPFKLTHD